MRALSRLIVILFLLCGGSWRADVSGAHAASCPSSGTYAGIQISHYWESTQANPYYRQTMACDGTVGIWVLDQDGILSIENMGNDIIFKTITAEQEAPPVLSCVYETVKVRVKVEVLSDRSTCADGILDIIMIETNKETSANYHCVACSSSGCVEYDGVNTYPATRLEHHVRLEYVPGAMDVQTVPVGYGHYQWKLLFQESPVPINKRFPIGPLDLLLLE
ncbi:MAG: hypothetical protein WAK57_16470 [Desulfobacterales bacterium]